MALITTKFRTGI